LKFTECGQYDARSVANRFWSPWVASDKGRVTRHEYLQAAGNTPERMETAAFMT